MKIKIAKGGESLRYPSSITLLMNFKLIDRGMKIKKIREKIKDKDGSINK